MTTRLTIMLILVTFSFSSPAQKLNNAAFHPDRYCLNLPPEWNKTKTITAVAYVLEQTIDELKDKDFCTDCRAAYNVRLYFDSVSVSNQQTSGPLEIGGIPHFTFSFDYSFNAGLLITDTSNRSISFLRLFGGDEVTTYSSQLTTNPQNTTYRFEPIYNSTGRVVGRRIVQDAPPVTTYIPQLNPFSILTESFISGLCMQRLFEIRRALKKLNQD